MSTATAKIQIWEYSRDEIKDSWFEWSCGLWWPDFEEAGIEQCFIAWDGDDVVGYQTIDADGLCVAIEVKEPGNGIGTALVAESGCTAPKENECPEFWEKFEND